MKRVLCFGLTLAMMMTLLMTSALAVDSEDTMEKTTTADGWRLRVVCDWQQK